MNERLSGHLTSGDLQELTRCTIDQIRHLVTAEILIPVEGGDGPGRFRLFNKMQAVALAYAMNWKKLFDLKAWARSVFEALLEMTEEELLEYFADGYTHLIPDEDGNFTLIRWEWDSKHGHAFNLKAVYDQVNEDLRRMVKGYEGSAGIPRTGRKTGAEKAAEENKKNKRKRKS